MIKQKMIVVLAPAYSQKAATALITRPLVMIIICGMVQTVINDIGWKVKTCKAIIMNM